MTKDFKKLLDDLGILPVTQDHQQIDTVIANVRDLIEHGEEGIAFENICQNIFEWDIPLSHANFERLVSLGRHYGFESKTWSFLEKVAK